MYKDFAICGICLVFSFCLAHELYGFVESFVDLFARNITQRNLLIRTDQHIKIPFYILYPGYLIQGFLQQHLKYNLTINKIPRMNYLLIPYSFTTGPEDTSPPKYK